MAMDVRAYREKPAGRDIPKGTAQALWEYLVSQTALIDGADGVL